MVPGPSSRLSALGSAVRPSEVPGALTDPSQVVALFNGISLTVAAAFGMGNHEQYLSNQDFSKAIHWVWVGNATTLISISLGKIAVMAFLLTIQGETYKARRRVPYFLCTSTVGFDYSAASL